MPDRVALVSGAGQGMGAACARRLAADGGRLVLFDLRQEPLDVLAAELSAAGAEVVTVRGDVRSPQPGVDAALTEFGRLDVLVNAAGILYGGSALDISEDEWDRVLGINLKGAFLISQCAARPMLDQGWGRIVHFSSTAGKTNSTLGGAHYTASKHGVLGIVRSMAIEFAPPRRDRQRGLPRPDRHRDGALIDLAGPRGRDRGLVPRRPAGPA